uniref:Ectonucleoside triphosphate diphosphohydrolase 1 n=1 Tax=Torpedo marmorata TaxID=7788 RepID=Q8UVX9_TORMA|nr:ecto-nucleoside triphosphate diphosphohydrolase-1 [Torpedo marmorata]
MPEARGGTKSSHWRRCLVVITAVLLLVVIAVLVIVAVRQNRPTPPNLKFGIVLDAGSSHTGLFIYQWLAEKMNDTGVVRQRDSCSVKGPGISSYWADVEQAGLSLRDCLNEAKRSIPVEQHRETPVFLGATAGMRLLRSQNSSQAEKLLQAVEAFIHSYPFDFQGAQIVTGADEGAFGWITINYLMGNFLQDMAGPHETVGALDLGGASTQITFVPDGEIESLDNSMHFRLYGKNYEMYTHSYLCYGKDQALKMFLQKLGVSANGTVFNPCFNEGYEKSINVSNFFTSPCTPMPPWTTHQTLRVIGTGNSHQCRDHVRQIFNQSSCAWNQCSFNGVYQPHVWGKYGAISAFYFVMKFFNMDKEKVSLDEVKVAVDKFCSTPWDQAKNEYKIKEKYLSENCFSGHYVLILLVDGYNFTSSTWNNIQFMKKIGGSDAGWTLGYMLNRTNMIPAELPRPKPMSKASYLSVMIIFSLLSFCWSSVCLYSGGRFADRDRRIWRRDLI